MSKELTIIIPHKDRVDALTDCLTSLSQCDEIDNFKTVIVDYSDDTNLFSKNLDAIIVRKRGPFHINLARNAGRPEVDTEYMAVLDCDIIIMPTLLTRALDQIKSPNICVIGAVRIRMAISDGQTRLALLDHVSLNNLIGSFMLFRTEDYDAIGGFNPLMRGWGYDDLDFVNRIEKHTGKNRGIMLDCYYHIEHPIRPAEDRGKEEQNNRTIAMKTHYDKEKEEWVWNI